MPSLNETKKINLDKKTYLQSQTNPYSKVQNFQSSLLPLPPPPSLQFKRQQKKYEIRKDSAEQKIENKRSLDNTKENIGKLMENAIIKSALNTDKLIDYSRQITQSARDLFFDHLKLQKDYINAFQPKWPEHMKISVDNYLVFQDKMIVLYTQMNNVCLKNIYDIKTNKEEEEKMEGSRV